MIAVLFLGLLAAGVTDSLQAQTVSLQGIVTDERSGQVLEGANILLISDEEPVRGAATDRNGFYQLAAIPAGEYLVRITYVGYRIYEEVLQLGDIERVTLSVTLTPDEALLEEVVIAPDGGASRREAGRQRISRADMRRVPAPAAGGDLASYLQAMPGVVATGDRGGQLYIRGGTPSQNAILMDGAVIYQPFHMIGFFSAFPEELVSGTDFYAGGFGPRYSDRISSVMDIRMRDGDRNRFQGSASLSPFVAEVVTEGPIARERSAWIASMRHSMIEQSGDWLLGREQPIHFESQYLRVSQVAAGDSRCSALAMRTYDRGRLDPELDDTFSWTNFVLSGRCQLLPEGSGMFIELNSGVSHMGNRMRTTDISELTSDITRVNLDATLTQFLGNVQLDYGMATHMKFMNYELSDLFELPRERVNILFGVGVHFQARIPLGDRAWIEPGSALALYPGEFDPSLEPRLRFSWQPFGRETEELSAAAGIYRQALTGITDMRDAGAAFIAWLPAPVGGSQMEAVHALLGWRQQLGGGFQFSVEGYRKWLRNQPVTTWSTLAQFNTNLALADGTVYGGDIRLEYNSRRFYGMIGYGYSRTEYESSQEHFGTWFGEPVQRYHPVHDQRHQIQALSSLDLGPFTFNARWQLGTGFPFTRPMGFDEFIAFDERLPDVRDEYGITRLIMDRPFDGRLPAYHRLDLSLERSFDFPGARLNLEAGAINSYNRRNLFYFDVYTQRRIDQLPFAPYLSVKLQTR